MEENIDYKDKYLRAMAEISNMKKQFAKEKEQLTFEVARPILLSMCDIFDSIYTATTFAYKKGFSRDAMREALNTIYKGVSNIIKNLGAEKIRISTPFGSDTPNSTMFDPELHEAVEVWDKIIDEKSDAYLRDGVIVKEVSRGYTYKDKLLRPSKVIVFKRKV
jgi:Molecular chaperone GrpE (heat shock protein)